MVPGHWNLSHQSSCWHDFGLGHQELPETIPWHDWGLSRDQRLFYGGHTSLATLVWEVREFNANDMVRCELATFDAGEWSHASVIHYSKCSWAAQRAKSASTVPTVVEINLCRVPETHAQYAILWCTPKAPVPKTAHQAQTGTRGIKGSPLPQTHGHPWGF